MVISHIALTSHWFMFDASDLFVVRIHLKYLILFGHWVTQSDKISRLWLILCVSFIALSSHYPLHWQCKIGIFGRLKMRVRCSLVIFFNGIFLSFLWPSLWNFAIQMPFYYWLYTFQRSLVPGAFVKPNKWCAPAGRFVRHALSHNRKLHVV